MATPIDPQPPSNVQDAHTNTNLGLLASLESPVKKGDSLLDLNHINHGTWISAFSDNAGGGGNAGSTVSGGVPKGDSKGSAISASEFTGKGGASSGGSVVDNNNALIKVFSDNAGDGGSAGSAARVLS
uniref:Uncharacterized protein n=1 Tax=Moniliophthora roreri TaxID=221103 RepID=A0A0W0FY25_MONRR